MRHHIDEEEEEEAAAFLKVIASPVKPKIKQEKANYRANITKEPVTWMSKTSAVHGSFLDTSLDAMTTLVRRKIQERCGSTQLLMSAIRRLKSGETGHVTPNEFRCTLTKFGIIVPQHILETLFNLFDSDRSGTIDFDEFAMWIMNSEFHPAPKAKALEVASPEEVIHQKAIKLFQIHPRLLSSLKRKFTYFELCGEVNRLQAGNLMSEDDVRQMFVLLDKQSAGNLDSNCLRRWISEGVFAPFPGSGKPTVVPTVEDAVARLCGKGNNHLVIDCFSNIPRDRGTKMNYDEFRRKLLANGLGNKVSDVQRLFVSLGGATGDADVDLLLRSIQPEPIDPLSAVCIKPKAAPVVPQCRADRRLKDSLRKTYKTLKIALETSADVSSGFIEPDAMWKLLCAHCTALSYDDFRFITQSLNVNSQNYIEVNHFLLVYDPKRSQSQHVLSGIASVPDYSEERNHAMSRESQPVTTAAPLHGQSVELPDKKAMELNNTLMRANLVLKQQWQSAIKACQRMDSDGVGTISKNVFISTLQLCVKSLSADEINRISEEYSSGKDSVDYNQCFRHFMNKFMSSESLHAGDLNASESAESFKRSAGPVHPWHFKYSKMLNVPKNAPVDPYWNRACSLARDPLRPHTAPVEGKSPFGFSLADQKKCDPKTIDLSQYEPKIISACKKISNHQNFRLFKDELKAAQNQKLRGCLTTNSFLAIVSKHQIQVTKSDIGALFRVFRTLGMQDMLSFEPFLCVCYATKGLE